MVHFFRQFSTDHDKNLVNYRKIKEEILAKYKGVHSVTLTPSHSTNLLQSRSTALVRPHTINMEATKVVVPMIRSVS